MYKPIILGIAMTALLVGSVPAQQWSPPVRISAPGGCEYPQILAIGDTLHVAYTYGRDGGRIEYLRSTDRGSNWGLPIVVSDTAASFHTYHVRVMVQEMIILVAWTATEEAWPYRHNIFCARSADGGQNWDREIPLLHPGLEPNMYFDAAGSGPLVNAVYGFYEGEIRRFKSLRSTDFGQTWSAPQDIFTCYDAGATSMASIGDTVHLAWGGRFAPTETYEVYYAESTDGGLSWEPNRMISDNDGRSSQLPTMALDDSANVALAWWDMKYSPNYTVGDILIRLSFNGGQSWGPEGIATTCHTADFSDVAWDGDTIRIAWEDQRGLPDGRMVYYSQSPNLIGWSPELRLDTEPEDSYNPALATCGGQVFAVWCDAICNPDTDICGGLYFSMYPFQPQGIREDVANELPEKATVFVYPNPFNSSVLISYSNLKGGEIAIYDIQGKLIKVFALEGGEDGQINWDATDASGETVSSGIYFARARASQESHAVKLLLVR